MIWKREYNTGIQEIDSQHQELVKIVTRLQSSLSSDAKYGEIGPTMKFLVEYTSKHFDAEERIMMKIGYPDIRIHQQLHKELIDEIHGILRKLKNRQSFTPIELYYLLSKWLMTHILDEDIKISKYYYQKVGKVMPSYLGSGTYETYGETKGRALVASTLEQLYLKVGNGEILESDAGTLAERKIKEYYTAHPVQNQDELRELFSDLESLVSQTLITGEQCSLFKRLIYNQMDLRASLDKAERIEDKLLFIKMLHQEEIIDNQAYDQMKIEEVKAF